MMTGHIRSTARATQSTFAVRFLARLLEMMEIARQRRHLAALSDWQLQDIGLSRADVARECTKPFWRV